MERPGESDIRTLDIERVQEFLAQTEVVFAVLFGSHARGTAGENSDVDIALRFPDEMDSHDRFRRRNRIDANLQEYAEAFVDVSDITALPTPVAYTALRDGMLLVGDERDVTEYRERIEREYERATDERERERRAFIDRLARGDV